MQQTFRVLQQSGNALEHHQNASQAAEDFSISDSKSIHKTTTATVVVDLLPPAYTSILGHSHLQVPASATQQSKVDSLKGKALSVGIISTCISTQGRPDALKL
jgi:hypothetical protein